MCKGDAYDFNRGRRSQHRNKGIGSGLIRESFKLAREMRYRSVLLVGDPAYYHRFGFKASSDFGIKHIHNIPDEYVMPSSWFQVRCRASAELPIVKHFR